MRTVHSRVTAVKELSPVIISMAVPTVIPAGVETSVSTMSMSAIRSPHHVLKTQRYAAT